MSSDSSSALAIALFSEVIAADQAIRQRLSRVLPKGMELSHFSVLNHLAHIGAERTPAQIAQTFGVTRGAMSNTLSKLEYAGHIHVRPDWDDARRKLVAISPSGRAARDRAIASIAPLLDAAVAGLGADHVKQALPILRALRAQMERND